MGFLSAKVCGLVHEASIVSALGKSENPNSVKSYFNIGTHQILQCPLNGEGFNVLCAHPRTISRDSNYRTYLEALIEEREIGEENRKLSERLKNIFILIDRVDQLTRFSYAVGSFLDYRHIISWELLSQEIFDKIKILENTLQRYGLDVFQIEREGKTLAGRIPLPGEARQDFQRTLFSLQHLIKQEYKGVLDVIGIHI